MYIHTYIYVPVNISCMCRHIQLCIKYVPLFICVICCIHNVFIYVCLYVCSRMSVLNVYIVYVYDVCVSLSVCLLSSYPYLLMFRCL